MAGADRCCTLTRKRKGNVVPFEEVKECLGTWPGALHREGHSVHMVSQVFSGHLRSTQGIHTFAGFLAHSGRPESPPS